MASTPTSASARAPPPTRRTPPRSRSSEEGRWRSEFGFYQRWYKTSAGKRPRACTWRGQSPRSCVEGHTAYRGVEPRAAQVSRWTTKLFFRVKQPTVRGWATDIKRIVIRSVGSYPLDPLGSTDPVISLTVPGHEGLPRAGARVVGRGAHRSASDRRHAQGSPDPCHSRGPDGQRQDHPGSLRWCWR